MAEEGEAEPAPVMAEEAPRKGSASGGMKVYVTSKIAEKGFGSFEGGIEISSYDSYGKINNEDLLQNVNGVHGILCTRRDVINKEILDAAGPQLRAITVLTGGRGRVDVEECEKRGIQVTTEFDVPDTFDEIRAEYATGLLLTTIRRTLEGMKEVENAGWGLWKPMWICGFELVGRTLGLFGMGPVGLGVARRLQAFGVGRIIYHDLEVKPDAAEVKAARVQDLDALLAESDVLVIAWQNDLKDTPATPFNEDAFKKMKQLSVLVNVSYGELVDHDALAEALKTKKPVACGLDVTSPDPLREGHPLLDTMKCVLTPGLVAATPIAMELASKAACDALSKAVLSTNV